MGEKRKIRNNVRQVQSHEVADIQVVGGHNNGKFTTFDFTTSVAVPSVGLCWGAGRGRHVQDPGDTPHLNKVRGPSPRTGVGGNLSIAGRPRRKISSRPGWQAQPVAAGSLRRPAFHSNQSPGRDPAPASLGGWSHSRAAGHKGMGGRGSAERNDWRNPPPPPPPGGGGCRSNLAASSSASARVPSGAPVGMDPESPRRRGSGAVCRPPGSDPEPLWAPALVKRTWAPDSAAPQSPSSVHASLCCPGGRPTAGGLPQHPLLVPQC